MFEGTYTALVTPFRNGQVDVKAFEALIERQVAVRRFRNSFPFG